MSVSIKTSSVFQRYSSAEQRPIVSDPCQGSCKENELQTQLFLLGSNSHSPPRQVSYMFEPTMEGDFILRGATEPWKAEDATAHSGGDWFHFWGWRPKTFLCEFNPWIGKSPWRRKWQPTPVFLSGESHRQRSLAVYSPWGHKRVGHCGRKTRNFSFAFTV